METVSAPILPTPVSEPGFVRSPYHLTEEQVGFFDHNGYLILRNMSSARRSRFWTKGCGTASGSTAACACCRYLSVPTGAPISVQRRSTGKLTPV
jgi:hypothetical protein